MLAHHVKWTVLLECILFSSISAFRASGDVNYPVRAVRRRFMVLFFQHFKTSCRRLQLLRRENAARLFCREAPAMFCGSQSFTRHFIGMGVRRWWLNFHFWLNFPLSGGELLNSILQLFYCFTALQHPSMNLKFPQTTFKSPSKVKSAVNHVQWHFQPLSNYSFLISINRLMARPFQWRSNARGNRCLQKNPMLSQMQNSVSIEKGTNSIIRLCEQWGDSSHNTDSKPKIVQASKH